MWYNIYNPSQLHGRGARERDEESPGIAGQDA